MWKFALHLVGRTAFHLSHQITHRQLWRHRHEHVDMIARQHASDNVNVIFRADLPDDVSHAQPDIAEQNFVTILRRPDQVIAVVENAMFTLIVLHEHTP
jgi:hypothetical protein